MMSKNAVLIVAAALCSVTPASAQENCVCVDGVLYCYDASTPSYDETPYFQAERPSYYYPYDGSPSQQSQSYSAASYEPQPQSPVPAGLVLLVGLGLIAAVIAAAYSSSETSIEDDIDETRALTERLEANAREADQRIAAYLEKLRSEGDGDV